MEKTARKDFLIVILAFIVQVVGIGLITEPTFWQLCAAVAFTTFLALALQWYWDKHLSCKHKNKTPQYGRFYCPDCGDIVD